jgi:hypothetical protein
MLISRLALIAALFLPILPGCSNNPHPHDIVLGAENHYEKNPNVTLAREYWIIITTTGGNYALFPRPDGDPSIVAECERGTPLAALFRNAALCEGARSAETADRVNALTLDEALQTSTFLHSQLVFSVQTVKSFSGDRTAIVPYPLYSDTIDICHAYTGDDGGVLNSVCDEERRSENGEPLARHIRSEAENTALASHLNALYGISR